MGSHKNKGEDVHNGSSKNSRRGYHRRRGSSGGPYQYVGNSVHGICKFCYPKLTSRIFFKKDMLNELQHIM